MKYVVEVSNVDKSYGKTKVLNNINLKLLSGKIYGIIGRNGSGKSVLMKCICGFVHPDVGEIHVYGRKVGKDVEFAQNVGFIIESPGFLPQYSAYKNLAYFYSIKNKIDKDTIEKYIRLVGLDPHDKKKVGKFSMGMKQRLGIAQAIMESPGLIIVDEPFNGLDISGVQEMRNLFLEMKKEGKTIILVSHNRDDINILCDEVYEMDQGVLKQMY